MRSIEDLRVKRNTQLLNAGRWLQRNGDTAGAQQLFDQAADLEFPAFSRAPGSIVEVSAAAAPKPRAATPAAASTEAASAVPEATTLGRLSWRGTHLWLEAEGGPTIWLAVDDEVPLAPDEEFRIGNRRLRLRTLKGGTYCLEGLSLDGKPVCSVLVHQAVFSIGREGCDLSFPQDVELASTHCEVTPGPFGSFLQNLSSGAGTFLRLPDAGARVHPGTRVLIDQQLFRVGTLPLGLSLVR